MTTAKYLLKEPEENLNRPSLGEYQTDHVRWYVSQVCGNSQNAIAVDSARTTTILASRRVWVDANADNTRWMIDAGIFGKLHDFIADDFVELRVVVAVILFHYRPHTVVTQAADVAALGVDDLIEQRELRIATIGHIQSVWLDKACQHSTFIVLATAVGSHINASRNSA